MQPIVALALATALAIAASPAAADTGSVYFDANDNAAAGETLFNVTFTGNQNVGLGRSVMPNLTTGGNNTAVGEIALDGDTSGDRNSAYGSGALLANTTGSFNVAEGYRALANATGSRNVAIGPHAGINLTTSSRNLDIWNPGVAGESGTIRIGSDANQHAAYLAGVWNKTAVGPTKAVVVNAKGHLATAPAPAAPLRGASGKLSRLRAENRRQSDQLQQLRSAVERLQKEVRAGG